MSACVDCVRGWSAMRSFKAKLQREASEQKQRFHRPAAGESLFDCAKSNQKRLAPGARRCGSSCTDPLRIWATAGWRRTRTSMCFKHRRLALRLPAMLAVLYGGLSHSVRAFGNCSCVALGRCSRRGSTSSIHGVVPPASMPSPCATCQHLRFISPHHGLKHRAVVARVSAQRVTRGTDIQAWIFVALLLCVLCGLKALRFSRGPESRVPSPESRVPSPELTPAPVLPVHSHNPGHARRLHR